METSWTLKFGRPDVFHRSSAYFSELCLGDSFRCSFRGTLPNLIRGRRQESFKGPLAGSLEESYWVFLLLLLLLFLLLLLLLQSLPSIGSLFVGGGAGGYGTPSGDSPLRSFPLIFPGLKTKKKKQHILRSLLLPNCCLFKRRVRKRKSASAGQLFFVLSAAITGHLFTDGPREVALALANVNSEIEAFFFFSGKWFSFLVLFKNILSVDDDLLGTFLLLLLLRRRQLAQVVEVHWLLSAEECIQRRTISSSPFPSPPSSSSSSCCVSFLWGAAQAVLPVVSSLNCPCLCRPLMNRSNDCFEERPLEAQG